MSGQGDGAGAARRVSAEGLRAFVCGVLTAVGVPPADAAIVADCLVSANLMGVDSHGVVRLAHYVRRLENGTVKARPTLAFERRAPALGILDGDDGLGHVVAWRASTHAMELAREAGSGTVLVRRSSHFGMAGFYVRRMVAEGFIGLALTATDALLIPHGARRPFFGTNPVAIGFPTDGIPVVLDMATTSIPYGKVALAHTEGRPIPADWGFDAAGHPTTDPAALVGLHPIAGPKGSGLAMVIDILCSVLTGMAWGPHIVSMYHEMERPRGLGHVLAALDLGRLMDPALFRARLGEMLAEFAALEPAEGHARVCYPGQPEGERAAERAERGIPLDPGLRRELQALGERLGVVLPTLTA